MDIEDDLPKRANDRSNDPLYLVTMQDLDPLSVTELHARIKMLEAEIARVNRKIDSSVNHRASAEALFRK